MHMAKHCRHRNDRRKSSRVPEPYKVSKGHGTRSGRVDAIGRNHGMRQTQHGPRLDHFGGNFARKVCDVLAGDATDHTNGSHHRQDEDRFVDEAVLFDSSGRGYKDGPRYSLFDEMMTLPVRETRRKRRANLKAKENSPDVAPVAPTLEAMSIPSNEFCDALSPIDVDVFEIDIACALHDSFPEGSDFSSDDFSDDSDSLDEYDDCWDAYEEDDREWIDLLEDDAVSYYSDYDDPFAIT
ncbi:hypothetical protein SCHPADRAFT_944185 [Schizopora paradoxa]|uniref:Uncharacterized protein n=1 Tax=Schizopora paradoxa TaxID=27342 RepID=A0A0H2RGW8_9AGAM|nr:hypothetical protein SCHPADRAFT_944185 [Schizopora paradoxa]